LVPPIAIFGQHLTKGPVKGGLFEWLLNNAAQIVVTDVMAVTADSAADDRRAGDSRFEKNVARVLKAGRVDQQVAGEKQFGDVIV
jgi:hypothetical protein